MIRSRCKDGKRLFVLNSSQQVHGSLPEHTARRFFVQLLHAVHYLHSKGYVHRDIKCKNIMLTGEDNISDQSVKIIDFGLSNVIQCGSSEQQKTFCGTPAYTAPEMVKSQDFFFFFPPFFVAQYFHQKILAQNYSGPEVDVWSLGVVLYLMLVGNFPFANVSSIISGTFTPQTWFSGSLNLLLRGMFDTSQTNRMKVAAALAHPWTTDASSSGRLKA